jgi:hypothetical protein
MSQDEESLLLSDAHDDYIAKLESRISTLESPCYKQNRKIFGCVLVFCVTIVVFYVSYRVLEDNFALGLFWLLMFIS